MKRLVVGAVKTLLGVTMHKTNLFDGLKSSAKVPKSFEFAKSLSYYLLTSQIFRIFAVNNKINQTIKTMKRTLTFLCGLLLCMSIQAEGAEPDKTGMELSAQDWCKNVVMGWNLGNSLECPGGETAWGNPRTTQEMIHAVREAGFNAIRIPVHWTDYLTDKTAMTIQDSWLARVKEVVDWCLAEDMYVVINDHHEDWYDRNPYYSKQEENNRKLAAMWTNIATYFRDYGDKLVFAGTNETTVNWANPTVENQAVQNSYNQTFIDAVRATGGKNYYRNLVVQTYACSPYHGLNGFVIPEDPSEGHLCIEFHYYDPYGYGLLTDNASQNYYYWGEAYKDKGKVPSDNEKTQASLFDRINNTWGKKGLGIVLGEYGVTNHYTDNDKDTQLENMSYYLKTTVANARQRGFAAFVWDNNGFGNGNEKFGIFNRWKNMEVETPWFLKGITEGAGQEYKEPEHIDPGTGGIENGTVLWEGDAVMDWGNGLQLPIPSSAFDTYGQNIILQLTYTLDFTDYDMIQLFYGDWQSNPSFFVDGIAIDKEYVPSSIYGVGSGSECVSNLTFSESVYNEALSRGLVIQGHGLRLNKVIVASPAGLSTTIVTPAGNPILYNLSGQRVKTTRKGVYIQNGRKRIVR